MQPNRLRSVLGSAVITVLACWTVSHGPTESSNAAAETAAVDPIVNLIQWEEASGGNDHWYAILAADHTWEEAENLAPTYEWQSLTGYLATIRDSAENAFITDSVLAGVDPPTEFDYFCVGGRFVDWTWEWITAEQLCYANWGPGVPSNVILGSRLAIANGGLWQNVHPDDAIVFFGSQRFWSVIEWGPLDTTVVTSICGNGIVECSETCDDTNTVGGDGCSENCRQEYWPCGLVIPGDANVDGFVTAADVIFAISYLWKSGPPPEPCIAFADFDCGGVFTAADVIVLVNYVFQSGNEPCDACLSPMVVQCEY